MDHGKRDVSRFPIAKGVYYKHDYSEGVDISRYKNIPVPTSYMAESQTMTSSEDMTTGGRQASCMWRTIMSLRGKSSGHGDAATSAGHGTGTLRMRTARTLS